MDDFDDSVFYDELEFMWLTDDQYREIAAANCDDLIVASVPKNAKVIRPKEIGEPVFIQAWIQLTPFG